MNATTVHVAQQGITWGSILISLVSGGGAAGVIVALIKLIAPMKAMSIKAEEKLREDLMAQLKVSEGETSVQAARFEARLDDQSKRLDDQRKMYENRIEFERVVHSNEVRVMRHRMNNLDQCLTMLLALIETNPEKAQEAARRVREMREKQESTEALEKATIAAAAALATAPIASPAEPTAPVTPQTP